nr:transposase [Actinophytocola xanthii]
MIEELVPDTLWQRVEPLLPPRPPRRSRYPGRLPVDDRVALAGIVFVLKTGVAARTQLLSDWGSSADAVHVAAASVVLRTSLAAGCLGQVGLHESR